MWHLTHLSFENYRTFERPESIELRPLTVLIGRNSSGKSAIARLPLLLQRGLSDEAIAPLEPQFDGHDFGDSFLDLVAHRVPTRSIKIQLRFEKHRYPFEIHTTVGYWSEFHLQGIREFKLVGEKIDFSAQWDGISTPVGQGLQYKVQINQEEVSGLSVSFPGLRPQFVLGWNHSQEDEISRIQLVLHEILQDSLGHLVYLGPFRDPPRRSERLPDSSQIDVGAHGRSAALALADDWLRRKGVLLKRVREWYMPYSGGMQLDLEQEGQRFSVVLRSPTDPTVTINLLDAGVGLSQVLPIVVQHELDPKSRWGQITVVEQPELHLHPGAHGDLADLYIAGQKRNESRFVIETHSENFVLRLRRRIAEKTLASEDVALYWVNDDVTATPRIQRINIDEMGGIDFWPSGVFAEDLAEVQAIRRAQKDRAP